MQFDNFNFPLKYEEPIFRPPSEGNSILLQLTVGCSHNLCTYCEMYRTKSYRVRSQNEIEKDLFRIKKYYEKNSGSIFSKEQPRKIFLCDGDALGVDDSDLYFCLERIKYYLPWIARVGTYATATNILGKS